MYHLCYDRYGNPISLEEYINLSRIPSYKILSKTYINNVEISTVWLGINHQYLEGAPLIFETMIFENEEGTKMYRYSTLKDALRHHIKLINVQLKRMSDG